MTLAAARPEATVTRWWPRLLGFVLLFAALQAGYASQRGAALQRLVIDQATVRPAAAVLNLLWPGLQVQAEGARLHAAGGGLNVLNGCEGTDVAFLLAAAMLVAPLPWRRRLGGLALGLALVYGLNLVRLVALFHAFRHDRVWFDHLHGGVGPALLVLAVGLFFFAWLQRSPWARAQA